MFSLSYDSNDGGTISVSADADGPAYIGVNDTDLAVQIPLRDLRKFARLLEDFSTVLEDTPWNV